MMSKRKHIPPTGKKDISPISKDAFGGWSIESRINGKNGFLIAAFLLSISLFIAFSPAVKNDFNHFDDQCYITDNVIIKSGLNLKSIVYAFSAIVVSNWHPVTLLSHMLDCQLFGVDSAAHHAVNVILHCVNVFLLFYLIRKISGKLFPALIISLLFAVHPLRVESVAWAAERKDLLSALFFFIGIIFYLKFLQKKTALRYISIVISFLLGLMSKPMLVTFPFALLLLDYFPLYRINISKSIFTDAEARRTIIRVFVEKIPLLIIAAIFCIVTFSTQRGESSVFNIPFTIRILNAFISYLLYFKLIFFPVNLAVFYPHPYTFHGFSVVSGIFSAIIVCSVTIVLVMFAPKRRYLLACWLWYLGLLVPVIGFVQVGDQALADRYTYLPSISIFALLGWSVYACVRRNKKLVVPLIISSAFVLTILVILTRQQVSVWKNDVTLFSHAIKVTKSNAKMHYNLGIALRSNGDLQGALSHFLSAKQINPADDMVYMDISSIYMTTGRFDDLEKICTELILLNPRSWYGYYGRGMGHFLKQEVDSAKQDLTRSLALNIDDIKAIEQIYAIAHQFKFQDLENESSRQLIARYNTNGSLESPSEFNK